MTGELKEVTIDENGNGTFELKDCEAQYVVMRYGNVRSQLYLDPSMDLEISIDNANLKQKASFAGEAAAINDYLNSRKIARPQHSYTCLPEAGFMAKVDSLYEANMQVLKEACLPDKFTDIEEERIKYLTYELLPPYPIYHRRYSNDTTYVASLVLKQKVQEVLEYDAKLLPLSEYKSYVDAVVYVNGRDMENPPKLGALRTVRYVIANVPDEKVREYLINQTTYSQIRSNGLEIEGTKELMAEFHTYVKNGAMVKKLHDLCLQWEGLRAGNPSPSFTCQDINGNSVSLSDLKGKLVYIDVWATWCGPCRGEIPHLKKLEEAYHGKDIYFVSISTDQDKTAWEKMVKELDLKGIQLHIGSDRSFMKDYLINSIPRFILLDKDGNIVSADMTRPSNPKTAEKFDELLDR